MIKPKEYYQELLDGFAASEKNVSKFCKDSGITKHAYYYAKSRLEPLKQKEEKKEMRRKEEKDLRVFLDNPYVEMTNNVCERAVKDFIMARKNSLFSYSEKGTEAASTLMTVIRTARLNQVDLEKYIAYVLKQLGKTRQSDIESLLPRSESLPEEVRSSKYEVPKGIIDSLKIDR